MLHDVPFFAYVAALALSFVLWRLVKLFVKLVVVVAIACLLVYGGAHYLKHGRLPIPALPR